MDIQLITYRGRAVAACTATRMFVSDEIECRGPEDPLTRFVFEMGMYAGQVLSGLRPGPYRDADACAYARMVLIPADLLEHPARETLDIERAAIELALPAEELRQALEEGLG